MSASSRVYANRVRRQSDLGDEWFDNYQASKSAEQLAEEEEKRRQQLQREADREAAYQKFLAQRQTPTEAYIQPQTTDSVRNSMAEEVDYANKKINELSKGEKDSLDKVVQYDRDAEAITTSIALAGLDPLTQIRAQKILEPEKKKAEEAKENLDKKDKDYSKYAQYMNEIKDAQEREKRQKNLEADLNTGNKARDFLNAAAYTAIDIGTSPVAGISALGENLKALGYADKDAPVNTNGRYFGLQNLSTDIEKATTNRIGDEHKGLQTAYGIGTSIGKAGVSMAAASGVTEALGLGAEAIGAARAAGEYDKARKIASAGSKVADLVTLPTFGASAYATTLQDAQERGLDHNKAQATAIVAGAAEMIFEKVSLDKFWDIAKNQGKAATRKTITNILAQSGIEGSEEVFTDIANTIGDVIINGDKSEFNQSIKAYEDEGYSEKDAFWKTFNDNLKNVSISFLGGAVSGGVFGSVGSIANSLDVKNNANALYSAIDEKGNQTFTGKDVADIYKKISDSTPEYGNTDGQSKVGEELKRKADVMYMMTKNGLEVSQKERNDLYKMQAFMEEQYATDDKYRQLVEEYRAQKTEENKVVGQEQASAQLTEMNRQLDNPDIENAEGNNIEEKTVNATMNQISDEVFNNIETPEEFRTQANDLNFETVYENIAKANTPEELASAISAAENSQNISPEDMKAIQTTVNIKKGELGLSDEDLDIQTPEKAFRAGTMDDSTFEPANEDEQRAYVQGKIERVKAISRESDPKQAIATDNQGNKFTVKSIKNEGDETFVTTNNGQTMPLSEISFATDKTNRVYANAAKSVNPQAYIDNYNPGYNADFYNDDINAIYNYGRLHGEKGSFADALKGTHYGDRLKGAQIFYDAGVSEFSNEKESKVKTPKTVEGKAEDKSGKLSKNAKKVLDAVSKKAGVDIVAVSDEGLKTKDGRTINGFFDAQNNQITLNADGKDIYKTLIHEAMGELSEEYAPKEMDELQSAIIDYYISKHPKKFNDTVAEYQKAYTNHEGSKSYREAANEYVNDILVDLFSDEQGVKDFAEFLSDKPKSLFDRFIDLIDSLIKGIKDLMGMTNHDTFKDDVEALQNLRKMALDTWQTAIQNKADTTTERKAASVEVKNSIEIDSMNRDLTDGQKEYFKNSKVVDDNGNLKVMYHGTENATFSEFNLEKMDDGMSIFTTDSKTVAETYAGSDLIADPYNALDFTTEKGAKEYFKNSDYELKKTDDGYALMLDGEVYIERDSIEDLMRQYAYEFGVENINGGTYEVYVNITNPLEVDASGKNWDDINYEIDGEVLETTREIAAYAHDHGYDGIIIKNVVDVGQYANTEEEQSEIAVAFNPNQVKSVYNENPSEKDNMRYSLDVDTEGNKLSEDQVKYFADSKVRDRDGKLIVVYHGTEADFTVFKPSDFIKEINGDSRIKGYFSEDKNVSEAYGDVKPYYLNITNPLVLDGKGKTLRGWKSFFNKNGITDVIFDSSLTGKNGLKDSLKGGTFEGKTYYTFYEILDMANYWYNDGNVTERIANAGYDGIQTNDEYEKAWMPFNSNAIKETSNLHPTDSDDVRFSLDVDSEGNKLSDNQKKFFANSKVVDDEGRLKVMFHGTTNADFTTFDTDNSKDGISLFFTDSDTVAKGYSGTKNRVKLTYNLEDLNKLMAPFDDSVVKEGNTYKVQEDGRTAFEGTFNEVKDYVLENYGVTGNGNYAVYLNATNPYVVDADGHYFDDIPHKGGTWTTQDYSAYAKDNGYDSLIINNVIDTSLYASNDEKYEPSQIVVVFNPNQVKSIENKSPSDDADIRYSIDVEEAKAHADEAEKHFGTTNNWKLAGYLDVNGKLLDFSDGQKYRVQDHREISDILDLPEDAGFSDGLIQFMNEGNIRLQEYGIDIAVKPNKAQRSRLRDFFNYLNGEVVVDYSRPNGDNAGSTEYDEGTASSRILNDIDSYFETGEVPEGNVMFSIEIDSDGKELSRGQKKYFANSKAVDEDGDLQKVYHGTIRTFYEFSREYANAEGDMGKGFYFTNDENDVERNYANEDGADFTNKIEREADYLEGVEGYEDKDHDEIVEELKKKYVEEPVALECYLNIENPCYVGDYNGNHSTILLSYDDIDMPSEEDFEDEDDYYYAQDEAIGEYVEGIIWDLDLDQSQIAEVSEVLYEAVNEGGITLENLKTRLNDKYLEDEEGNLIANEVARQIVESLGYDGIIDTTVSEKFKNMDLTSDSTHYIVFNSNQAKLTTNENPTDSSDIRYSIEVVDDIEKRTKRYELDTDLLDMMGEESYGQITDDTMSKILNSVNGLFKGQTVDRTTINNVAKEIKDFANSKISTDHLTDELENLFNYMQNSEIDSREVFDMFKTVARDILEQGETEDYDTNGFRKYIKGMKIRLNDNQKDYVAKAFDSYNDFRKSNFGKLTLSEEGQNLDSLWSEIVAQSGNQLNIDENESSQPIALVDYIDSLKGNPVNNYGGNMDEVSTDLAIRMLEKYYAAEQDAIVNNATEEALKNADPETKRILEDAREQMRKAEQNFKKSVKDEYAKRKAQIIRDLTKNKDDASRYNKLYADIDKLKDQLDAKEKRFVKMMAQHKQPLQEYMESQNRKDEKRKIEQISNRLMKMVYSPTDKLHMPEALRKPIGDFLMGIDFISHRGQPDSMQKVRWQTRMDALRKFLAEDNEELHNVKELMEDDLLTDMEDFTYRNSEVNKVSQMNSEELHNLYQILTRLSATVSKANQTFANDVFKNIDELNDVSLKSMREMRDPKFTHPVLMSVKDFFGKDLEDPITYFSLLGRAPKTLFDGFLKGFDKRTSLIKQAQEFMNEIMPDGAYKWENDKHTFNTSEGEIELTTAQIMSLYETKKRKNADAHLFRGGIKSQRTEMGHTFTSPKAVHLSESDYDTIFGTLTEDQKQIADKMQEFMADVCGEKGNEVSMTLWGYKKFTEKDYFPMKVDSSSRNTSNQDANVQNLYANKNMSASKELVDKADNPLLITDIFDVFTDHVADMATYYGMVLPQMDAMRWFNYRQKQIKGTGENVLDGTKQEIERIYGKAGVQYFTNLMLGINGTEPKARGNNLQNKMIGRYKKVAVMAKIRVAIQQPTSFVRAYDEMDGKYLTQALVSTNPVKYANKAKEKSMLAWWKGQGYYESYIGKGLKDIIVGKNPVYQAVEDFEGWGAQTADDLTWGILYHAAELEVKDKTDLKEGTKAFDDAVVKRFEEVVSKTQVVDTTLHRTDIMRSQNDLVKIATSFMTEPLKTYNMVLRSVVGAERDRDKKAYRKLIRTLFVYLINNALLTAVTTTWDAFRKDDDETPYGDRWLETYGKEFVDNINPVNMIPFVKDVVDVISSKLTGEYYGATDMTYDGISKAALGVSHLIKRISGDNVSKSDYGIAKEMAQALSILSGVPVYNVWNDIEGIHNGFFENWETKAPSEYKGFYKAIDNGGDILAEVNKLKEAGKEERTIKAQITSHYKSDYLEMTDLTEKANMKNTLIKAFMSAGDTREQAINKIDKWEKGAL